MEESNVKQERVVNLVNFVRGCEPRKPMDLVMPVRKQMEMGRFYGLPQTFLLQYDAMLREDMIALCDKSDRLLKFGVWMEMNRQLTEKVGIPWRGRPGFDWDWYVNPGFLPAYTPTQREAIIDEVFAAFAAHFGYYPQVAGSWLLDAHSMAYMSEQYHVKAFCICREQYAVDAYTLWGGYYSGGYYPSKNNMLCPASREENTISTPVFRMLGIDPIYGYDEKINHAGFEQGCCTMEPVWSSGNNSDVLDWYFRQYFENPCVCFSHCTTGQENSFGWEKMKKGYVMQLEKLQKLQMAGSVRIEFLEETGIRFRKNFSHTPTSALCALQDWAGNGYKSIWFSSQFYRANLFFDRTNLFFRDIQIFDDRYQEAYLKEPNPNWDARYENLSVVDARLWSTESNSCRLKVADDAVDIMVEEKGETLAVDIVRGEHPTAQIVLTADRILIRGCSSIEYDLGAPDRPVKIGADGLKFVRNGFAYMVGINGIVLPTSTGCKIEPINNCISFCMH